MIIIPVSNQPNQDFTVTIPQEGQNIVLRFYIYWNRIANYWQATISDVVNNITILEGFPLLTGDIPFPDSLQQFQYLNIGHAYIIPLSSKAPNYPGETDWGTNFVMMWQ